MNIWPRTSAVRKIAVAKIMHSHSRRPKRGGCGLGSGRVCWKLPQANFNRHRNSSWRTGEGAQSLTSRTLLSPGWLRPCSLCRHAPDRFGRARRFRQGATLLLPSRPSSFLGRLRQSRVEDLVRLATSTSAPKPKSRASPLPIFARRQQPRL